MIMLFYFFVFILGLAIGSFLNVVICRLETQEDIVKKRSYCPVCGHVLSWQDLFPLMSFIFLRGRCRYCRRQISWQYPLVELATGFLFIAVFYFLGAKGREVFEILSLGAVEWATMIYWFYIVCSLLVVFVYDLKHYLIPDKIIFPAMVISFLWQIALPLMQNGGDGAVNLFDNFIAAFYRLLPFLFSAVGAAAFFLAIILITRGQGMGLGDAKLSFLMGLVLGWPGILLALFLAFFAGAAVGLTLMALKKKTMQSQIPFGPFLAGAAVLALFAEDFLARVAWQFYPIIF